MVTAMSFDRAADFYDATRALPPDVHDRLTEMLLAELAPRRLCLEIGVGTGRIALPLVEGGVHMIGADIARKMLERLVVNAGGRQVPPLCVADVTVLPFVSGAFDAVLASHLLHLVPDWRTTVDESVRVLHPGSVFLVDFGGAPPAPWHETISAVLKDNGVVRMRPGMSDPGPVIEHLKGRARARPLTPLVFPVARSLGQDLDDWEAQRHSWTWSLSRAQVETAVNTVRGWAADNDWPLDRRVTLERTIQWWAFDIASSD
jgi:ubiquinone/menaquinone biosynthesis C-methylase UbiE